MSTILHKRKGIIFLLVALLVVTMGGFTAAYAENTTATVEFEADPGINKLELTSAPSINFGSHTLPVAPATFSAVSIDSPLKVTDTRGVPLGWNVTAQLSAFATTGGTPVSDSMPGANIDLLSGAVAKSGSGLSANPPTVEQAINIVANGSASKIVSAGVDTSFGVWDTTWTNSNVILNLPNIPAVGSNEATITWTVNSGPGI